MLFESDLSHSLGVATSEYKAVEELFVVFFESFCDAYLVFRFSHRFLGFLNCSSFVGKRSVQIQIESRHVKVKGASCLLLDLFIDLLCRFNEVHKFVHLFPVGLLIDNLLNLDVLEHRGKHSNRDSNRTDRSHSRLLGQAVMNELLGGCVVQIDIVSVDIFCLGFVQETLCLWSREEVQHSANIRFLCDFSEILMHQLVSPVITHATLDQVVTSVSKSVDASNLGVIHLFEVLVVDIETKLGHKVVFNEFVDNIRGLLKSMESRQLIRVQSKITLNLLKQLFDSSKGLVHLSLFNRVSVLQHVSHHP